MANQDALARAIEYLGAVEVAPRNNDEQSGFYAWKDGGLPQWRVARGCDIESAFDGYSFASEPDHVSMPSWWKPDSRFAYRPLRNDDGTRWLEGPDDGYFVKQGTAALLRHGRARGAERITADLETGEEVSA